MENSSGRKNAALLYADLDRSALGTPGRIGEQLNGTCVLGWTIKRLEQADRLDEIIVFCPARQQERIRGLLADSSAIVKGLQEEVPVSSRVRARKWSLTSWRGGIHGATQFDEQVFTQEMVQYAREREIYTALSAASEAALVDPALIDALLEHHHEHGEEMRFTFTQAAPGLCGCAFRLDLLHELVQAGAYIGDLLRYEPKLPHSDYIVNESNYKVDPALYTTEFRYIADTRRSFQAIEKLLKRGGAGGQGWDARRIVAAMAEQQAETDELPREVEIEINSQPSLRIKGYPHRRGMKGEAGRSKDEDRGPMSLARFEKIMDDLRGYDDICLTLGGFGEAPAHPALMEMVEAAKTAGIWGINIETDGRLLKGELAESLRGGQVDVISVFPDANSGALYRQVKGEDCLDEITRQLESFIEKVKDGGPLVIPHLVKTRETMDRMEEFYDRWLTRCGGAVIEGYNDFAGQIEDRSVMDMSPPGRTACRRLFRSMTILADGRVTICGQDFRGERAIGKVGEKSVRELWRSEELERLRQAHREGRFHENELCAKCKEWHR